MIKENQRLLNLLNVLSDGTLVLMSMLVAKPIRFNVFNGIDSISPSKYLLLGVVAAALSMLIYTLYGLYESQRFVDFHKEADRLLKANLLITLILLALLYVFHLENFSRWILMIFFACTSTLLLLKRAFMRSILRRMRKRGLNRKHVVLVGHGPNAKTYLNKVLANPEFGLIVDGYVSDETSLTYLTHLGTYKELETVLDTHMPDEVVIALPTGHEVFLPQLTTTCEKVGIRLSLISYYVGYTSPSSRMVMLDGLAMINLRHIPLDNIGNAFFKRALDVVGAALVTMITLPVMVIATIGIKCSSPGPILFKQKRVGKGNKHFYIYKFRSMLISDQADTDWGPQANDRITRFGRWMRKYSIDELPQLVNVLKGEMSLVGPRPEIPFFAKKFREQIPRYMVKHQVLPGMTGWAQVNGLRGDTPISERIKYDLFYLENWTILMDLKILWKTLFHLSAK